MRNFRRSIAMLIVFIAFAYNTEFIMRLIGFGRIPYDNKYDIVATTHHFPIFVYNHSDNISHQLRMNATWQEEIVRTLSYFVKPGDTVIHLGASIGFDDILLSRFVGKNGMVYSFEPNPDNLAILKKNFALNEVGRNVKLYDKAVTNEFTTLDLCFYNSNIGGGSLWFAKEEGTDKCHKVKTTTLDSEFSTLKKVDVIFMDIEGSELKALEGGRKLIERSGNPIIIMEWYSSFINEISDTKKFFAQSLAEGYRFWLIKESSLTKVDPYTLDAICGICDIVITKQLLSNEISLPELE